MGDVVSSRHRLKLLSPSELPPASPSAPPVVMSRSELRLRMLLVDSVEGRWYVFDPESGDIIFLSAEVAEALVTLQREGGLSEELMDGIVEALQLRPVDEPQPPTGYTQWGLTIHLNHACNLACEYCYADGRTSDFDGVAKGSYGGAVSFMSPEVLEQALDRFMADAPTDKVVVGFLGGEPLLSEKRFLEAIRMIDEMAAKHGRTVRFELTTNGTRLTDAILECFGTHEFSIVISVDGDRETHDRQRPMANGKGSYDEVIQAVERLSRLPVRLGVRMTAIRGRPEVTRAHAALADTCASAAGFQFHTYGADALRPMDDAERMQLFDHYRDIAHRILGGDEKAGKLMAIRDVILDIITKRKKQYQCAAGRWSSTVTPTGDVYPCHRFVGMTDYAVGNVHDDAFHFAARPAFEQNAVHNRVFRSDGTKNCALCYAHHTCGGGCAQIAAANTGRIGELPPFYCQETRLRVQAVIRALVERMQIQRAREHHGVAYPLVTGEHRGEV